MHPRILRVVTMTAFLVIASPALAHVSERALVLILPTDIYTRFGVAAVVLTIVLTVALRPAIFHRILGADWVEPAADPTNPRPGRLAIATSVLAFLAFAFLVLTGLGGSRDPLVNLLPLTLFTVWWICFPLAQVAFGNIWVWINPWTGPATLAFGDLKPLRMPDWLASWPALATYILTGIYTLTDIAPDDPERLAKVAAGYWFFHFAMCGIFGLGWLHRGEGFTLFFDLIAKLSVVARRGIRFPGKAIFSGSVPDASVGVFAVTSLAIGSFDGLNETFWWMGQIGVNPLEFPGRSAVVWENRLGLFGSILLLNLVFAFAVWLGLVLTGRRGEFLRLWRMLALSILPIALGYHAAHYLTSALVNLQYFAVSLNDPMQTGVGFLGLNSHSITTSFFNQHHTVRAIWLTQASAIVVAHIVAVILAHGITLTLFRRHGPAVIAQLPISIFMIGYTFLGLWLLASPVAL